MLSLMRCWKGLLLLFAVVGVCGGVFWAYWQIDNHRVRESYRRAGQIIQALEQHRVVEGKYPKRLADLCPKYAKRIEEPTAGNGKWVYSVSDDGSYFDLGFKGSDTYPSRFYDSKSKEWWIDTK
ncbi:MAG: hypothetical protein L6Q92_09900 [Phycisphaerae bacterium]|nr:hypothetical protein [Phycisphaerae bacterium]